MLIPANFPNLIDPVLDHVFHTTLDEERKADHYREKVFTITKNNRSTDRFLGIGGLADFAEHKGAMQVDYIYEQYMRTVTPIEYSKKLPISKRLLEEDLYDEVESVPAMMARAFNRTQEKQTADTFNGAFDTITTADGLSLCNTAHTSKSPDAGANQSNSGTLALTYANLITTRRLIRQFKDDRGELMECRGDLLIAPINLEQTAREIIEGEFKHQSMDRDPNVARGILGGGGTIDLWVWDRMSDIDNWFLVDKRMMKLACRWIDKVRLETKTVWDHDHRAIIYSAYARYTRGVRDWRWVYGHKVA